MSERAEALKLQQRLVEVFALGPLQATIVHLGILRVKLQVPGCHRVLAVHRSAHEEESPFQIGMDVGDGLEFIDYSVSFEGLLSDIVFNFMTDAYDYSLFEHVMHNVYEGAKPVDWSDERSMRLLGHYLLSNKLELLCIGNMQLPGLDFLGRIDIANVPMFLYGVDELPSWLL
jgi:hypothetical protein